MSELAFKVIPLGTKLKIGLRALAETFSTFSDQKSYVTEEDDHFVYTIEKCPVCWERHTDRPVCFAATGVIQEGLRWVSGGKDFKVEQTHCHAMGHDTCDFSIYKKPLS